MSVMSSTVSSKAAGEGKNTSSYAAAAAKPVTIPNGSDPNGSDQTFRQRKAAPTSNGHRTNGSMRMQHRNSGVDPSQASGGLLGSHVQWIANNLEERLKKLGDSPGWIGSIARQAIAQGHWVEDHVEEEWTLRKDAIGGIDNMWILLSSVSRFNPVCTATFVLSDKVKRENLERIIHRQVDVFPKYKQVLRNRGRRFHGSVFVDDPNWDIKNHISNDVLPEPAGNKELDEYTARLIAQPWDFNKPLWEMIVIDNFKGDGLDGSAIITRGHHTLTDGQGFVMSQLYISSFGEDLENLLTDGRATLSSARRGTAKPSKLHKGLKPLDRFHNYLLLQILMFFLFWFVTVLSSIAEAFGGIAQGFNFATHFLTDSWRARHLTSDYLGERVQGREFSTSKAVSMSEVRKLQRAFSGPTPGGWVSQALGGKRASWWGHLTLNDILVTVIADVMADELEHQEEVRLPTIGSKIKRVANKILPTHLALMIPISIRPVANWEMRNWSTGSVVWLRMPDGGKHGLPMSGRAMHARLHDVSKRLKILKNSILPTLTFHSVQLTGQAPVLFPSPLWRPIRSIVGAFLELILTSFSAVVTNVPGPSGKEGITFADAQVARWAASPPQAGKGTLGIGIISYADGICITVAADHVPDSPSDGVARRLTSKFSTRWQQYLETADDILERRELRSQD